MDNFSMFVLTYLFVTASSLPCLTVGDVQTHYVYNNKTTAYYKLHSSPLSHRQAQTVCRDVESAELLIPSSPDDAEQVSALRKQYDISQPLWIYSKDGCYAMKTDLDIAQMACNEEMPFVCKVTAAENCKALGYRYYPETSSCYKVPPYAKTWDKALVHCREDNAHLLVLNSEKEAEVIKEYLKTVPPVSDAYNNLYFHSGFKADKPSRDFRTIYGKTLAESGFVGWSPKEPNNWKNEEYCGSVVRENGRYNDIFCDLAFGFICEKDIPSLEATMNRETNSSAPKTNADSETNSKMPAHGSDIHDNSDRADDGKVTAAENCKALGYRYYPETSSCYKVPPYAKTWDKALVQCREDNAHLLVLNSEKEAEVIKEYLKTVPPVPDAYNNLYFHSGFKADKPSRDFRTIYGKTLAESGFVGWSPKEPNNWKNEEYCGSVVRENGRYNDIFCDLAFGFICEKNIPSLEATMNRETNSSAPKTNADSETNSKMPAHASDIHDNSDRADDGNNKITYNIIHLSKSIIDDKNI